MRRVYWRSVPRHQREHDGIHVIEQLQEPFYFRIWHIPGDGRSSPCIWKSAGSLLDFIEPDGHVDEAGDDERDEGTIYEDSVFPRENLRRIYRNDPYKEYGLDADGDEEVQARQCSRDIRLDLSPGYSPRLNCTSTSSDIVNINGDIWYEILTTVYMPRAP